MKLDLQIEKHSVLNNITHFFSKEDAYIQELLQNARRAEASRVEVQIDTQAGTLTVTDDGHGISDPQSLLTIGKSDWAEAIKEETPAGMGFYSVFKLGSRASFRSKRFLLEMDIGELKRGKQATLTESLPHIKGTVVTVHSTWPKLLDNNKLCEAVIDGAMRKWQRQAKYMPFETTISVDKKRVVAPAFDARKLSKPGAFRVERPWGCIDVTFECESYYGRDRYLLISQGVAVEINDSLVIDRRDQLDSRLNIHVLCRPGIVSFRLPDRDGLLKDDKLKAFMEDLRQSLVESVLQRIEGLLDNKQREQLASIVYAFNEDRVVKLPEQLQWLTFYGDGFCHSKLTRAAVAKKLAEGAEVCTANICCSEALSFCPVEVLVLHGKTDKLLRKMFPDARTISELEVRVEPDERGDTLWRANKVKLTYDNGETRELNPVAEQSVLSSDFESEFVPPDAERAAKRSGETFAVIHSCAGEIEMPDLEKWHEFYDEDMSYEEASELWRTGEQNTDIVRTWKGIPGDGVTLSEFMAVLRDKLNIKRPASISLRNLALDNVWDNQFDVHTATVAIKERGQPSRLVQLEEKDGHLEVVGETTEPENDQQEEAEAVEVNEEE